jgi:hypothetical protein
MTRLSSDRGLRLFDAHEPLDRGAVEHDSPLERLLELAVWHLDVFQDAEDVGELEAHELDLLALDTLQNPGLRVVLDHPGIMPTFSEGLPSELTRRTKDTKKEKQSVEASMEVSSNA